MRIGIVGWSARTGVGQILRDLWDLGFAQSWLVPKHPLPHIGIDETVCPPEAIRCERRGDDEKYAAFLDGIDALVFIESPHVEGYDLVQEARRRSVLTCCVPMMEWLPPLQEWVADVDLMWAPTRWSARELESYASDMRAFGIQCRWRGEHVVGGRWGVNVDRFAFHERGKVERFLFCNGNGGCLGRKGALAVAIAARFAPQTRVIFRTQKAAEIPPLPSNVEVIVENAAEKWGIYDRGDVLLAPSRFEGLGLQHYEAQACGLPVVTTNAAPMNECLPLRVIPATHGRDSLCGRSLSTWDVDPHALARTMIELNGGDVSTASRAARRYVEAGHNLAQIALDLRAELVARKK